MKDDKLVKLDTTCNETGFVIKKYDNSSKIGAYIPSLMSDIDMKKGPWEQKTVNIRQNVFKNDNIPFRFDPIILCNYYDINQRDDAVYYVDKQLGEKIRIKYEDNDIKKAFFFDEDYKMTDLLVERVNELEEQLRLKDEKITQLEEQIKSIVSIIDEIRGE